MHAKHAADSEKMRVSCAFSAAYGLLIFIYGPWWLVRACCVRRITWLNANAWSWGLVRHSFTRSLAMRPWIERLWRLLCTFSEHSHEAAASIPLERALEILKDLETRSSSVAWPRLLGLGAGRFRTPPAM